MRSNDCIRLRVLHKMNVGSCISLLLIIGMLIREENCQDYHVDETSFNKIARKGMCSLKCSEDIHCLTDCVNSRREIELEKAEANATLICRDVEYIILAHSPGVFVIEHRLSENDNWTNAVISNGTRARLLGREDTLYQYRFYRVSSTGLSKPETTEWFNTMSSTYVPEKVQSISQPVIQVEPEDPHLLRAELSITPAEDGTCFYEVLCREETNRVIENHLAATLDLNVILTRLNFGTEYTVIATAYTQRRIESTRTEMTFTTNTCLGFYNNLTFCAPPLVEGLNAMAIPKTRDIFDIKVTWKLPKLIPRSYLILIYPSTAANEFPIIRRTLSGDVTNTIFANVTILEEYDVIISAFSSAGRGPSTYDRFVVPKRSGNLSDTTVLYVVGGMCTCTGVIVTVWCWRFILKKQSGKQVRKDEYEIDTKQSVITRELGSGAFGIVKFGRLKDDKGKVTEVAVKMLKDDQNKEHRREFMLEIEMIKAVGRHPNIVSLVGYRKATKYPCLVVEYCPRGDLLSFLRAAKSSAESTAPANEILEPCAPNPDSTERDVVVHEVYVGNRTSQNDEGYIQVTSFVTKQSAKCDDNIVTVMDMLNFGRQIARGMEFLSSKKIVHRDLAARNVLVCENRTVKISDFGLSRNVCEDNIYKKLGNGRMPFKWMAIESLTHQVYTTSSDVWSFGVLLWEIITLGADPYPGIPTLQILNYLQSGRRMERPPDCSVPLYNMALYCWEASAMNRPTFTSLRQELENLIGETAGEEYFDFECVKYGGDETRR